MTEQQLTDAHDHIVELRKDDEQVVTSLIDNLKGTEILRLLVDDYIYYAAYCRELDMQVRDYSRRRDLFLEVARNAIDGV